MNLKIKLIILFVLLIALFSTVNTTYSRYASEATGSFTTNIASWKIKLNNTDITSSSSNTVTLTPVYVTGTNTKAGTIAPGTGGYFDIVVDFTDVDVSFNGVLSGDFTNNPGDLNFTKFQANLGSAYNGSSLTHDIPINNTQIYLIDSLSIDSSNPTADFGIYTYRIYFEWTDSCTSGCDDDEDTAVGLAAANGTLTAPTVNLTLSFSQALDSD